MRFAYSFQSPQPFSPSLVPAGRTVAETKEPPAQPVPQAPAEVRFGDGLPDDLDQRVRLVGEW